MVLLLGQDNPEIVFDEDKRRDGDHDGPDGDESCVFVHRDVLWIAHRILARVGPFKKR
jgi:hypothetical protein